MKTPIKPPACCGFEIQEFDGLNNTPAIPLIPRAWTEMLLQGSCSQELIGSWDHKVILAMTGGVAAGLITWTHEAWRKLIWVHLGYVAPEYRRRGIYRLMFERLVLNAQQLRAGEIQGGTHHNNGPMLEVARKLGRTISFVTTRFIVPPPTVLSILTAPTPPYVKPKRRRYRE